MDGAMIRVVEDAFHYGFPLDAQALLLLEIDGIDQILDEQLASIVEIARKNHGSDVKQCSDPARRAELWSARKRAFGAIGRISHSYCTQDACVPAIQVAGGDGSRQPDRSRGTTCGSPTSSTPAMATSILFSCLTRTIPKTFSVSSVPARSCWSIASPSAGP